MNKMQKFLFIIIIESQMFHANGFLLEWDISLLWSTSAFNVYTNDNPYHTT